MTKVINNLVLKFLSEREILGLPVEICLNKFIKMEFLYIFKSPSTIAISYFKLFFFCYKILMVAKNG